MPIRHCVVGLGLLTALSANADDVATTYQISSNAAVTKTVIKKASADKEDMLRKFFFEKVAEKIATLPNVTGVEFNKDVKPEVSSSQWYDYWEYKRDFPVMVQLKLPTPVTMMVKVEETYRRCKSLAEKESRSTTPIYDDYGYGSGDTVDCTLASKVKITGPFSVYGNFASSVRVDGLLKEKQSIQFELSRDWTEKTTLRLETRFNVESELFDQSLFQFLEAFNIALPAADASFGPLGMVQAKNVYTRNNILLGVSRVLRILNERLVE